MIRYLLFILVFLISAGNSHGQAQEKEVLQSIKKGRTDVLGRFLEQGEDIDAQYDRGRYTLLNYAIRYENKNAVKMLLSKGADPDLSSKDKTPLIHAVLKKELMIIHELINGGAAIDTTVKKGNTALIYAAKSGYLNGVRMLIENGANALKTNDKGLMALDYANMANFPDVAEYLVKILEMRNYYKGLPDYTDGPHMEWLSDSLLHVLYMIYDTVLNYPLKREKYITANTDTVRINGFAYDTLEYVIPKSINDEPVTYQGVSRILAIGDIHGHYNALVKYLQINNVIDQNLNWTWGDGHIVFLGDVFDRGNEVTESLWFIYQLDLKARKHGGRVHMLLGNHEVMVMLNDTRYLNRKYEFFSNYFIRDYADFYNLNAVLGNYLRTRNTVITINDCIFSHAGISPSIFQRRLSFEKINLLLQKFLSVNPEMPMLNADLTSLVLNAEGPLWYRGYILDGIAGTAGITERQVRSILKYYGMSKMVIAHTEVKRMVSLFDGRVIAIDVPIRTDDVVPEALLIEDGKFYRLTSKGELIACIFEEKNREVQDQFR